MSRRHRLLTRMLLIGLLALTIAVGSALATTTPQAARSLPAAPIHATQLLKLTASDGESDDQFGVSTAMSGDVLVIGAYQDDVGLNVDQGSAYVFMRNEGGTWDFIKKLVANDGAAGDHFGSGVAVSGDVIIIGSYLDTVGTNTAQGAAYVFYRDQGGPNNWGFVKKLVADDGAAGDSFGFSVGVSGDVAIVGAYGHAAGLNRTQGSAYVFSRTAGGPDNWGQIQHLFASDGTAGYSFGYAVAMSGDVAVVGAQAKVNGHDYQGAAHVFMRDQGGINNWGWTRQLIASDGAEYELFGQSVAVSGDVIVIGSPSHATRGAAYVFGRNQSGANQWGFIKELRANDGEVNDQFASSVAIDGNVIAVGADYAGPDDHGAVYMFARDRDGLSKWGFVQELVADDGESGDYFGRSVALNSTLDLAAVGALLNNDQAGSAYLFGGVSYADYVIDLPLIMR